MKPGGEWACAALKRVLFAAAGAPLLGRKFGQAFNKRLRALATLALGLHELAGGKAVQPQQPQRAFLAFDARQNAAGGGSQKTGGRGSADKREDKVEGVRQGSYLPDFVRMPEARVFATAANCCAPLAGVGAATTR